MKRLLTSSRSERQSLFSRRAALQSLTAMAMSPWLPLAHALRDAPERRHCILLWMAGGASQTDTFDMKTDHANGGEFKEIETSVPGIRISEHLPQLAKQAEHLAIIRSISTKEGDHGRGTYLMRTGRTPGGAITFPTLGSLISKELEYDALELPSYIAISPYQAFNRAAFGPGFLGPKHASITVSAVNEFTPNAATTDDYAELGLDNIQFSDQLTEQEVDQRLELWKSFQDDFLKQRNNGAPLAHHTVYQRAIRMLKSEASQAFDLTREPNSVRDAYGKGRFGQGCLMARRLIEQGVPFVEVTLGFDGGNAGWDTHQNNFPAVRSLSQQLDQGWSTLMKELGERGLLESTTILWAGEFGRTPVINGAAGRDHFPGAWTCVLAGGGIQGGQVYGQTSPDGMQVKEAPVSQADLLATVCEATGIDPSKENVSPIGRPFALAEGTAIESLLAGKTRN